MPNTDNARPAEQGGATEDAEVLLALGDRFAVELRSTIADLFEAPAERIAACAALSHPFDADGSRPWQEFAKVFAVLGQFAEERRAALARRAAESISVCPNCEA